MKQGTIGLAVALVCSLGWNAYAIHEVLTLDNRVDELTEHIEAKDVAMKGKEKQLEALQREVSSRDEAVKELTDNVQTLTKAIQAKDEALKAKNEELAKLQKKKATPTVSRGQSFREDTLLGTNFEVTWYNDYGHTKSGRFVADNVTIAVDPSVIPLGSWVRIEMPDGREFVRRADDTGGAVKGRIVDIYDNVSTKELYKRGRTRGVKVTLLRKST